MKIGPISAQSIHLSGTTTFAPDVKNQNYQPRPNPAANVTRNFCYLDVPTSKQNANGWSRVQISFMIIAVSKLQYIAIA